MVAWRGFSLVLFCLLVLSVSPAESAGEACVKEVLHKFCLGGDAAALIKNHPPSRVVPSGSGKRLLYNADNVIVGVTGGKVGMISLVKANPTWLKYRDLKASLVKRYGEPKDHSYFPSYADTPETRSTSISIGKGRVMLFWQQAGWTITLGWSDNDVMMLVYLHEALQKQSDNVSGDGL